MNKQYKVPEGTRIGHAHLKVSNLKESLKFYTGLLGFELITTYGDSAAFISAGGYHHHIGLNTWQSKGGNKPAKGTTGLFHVAILYSQRRELAEIVQRLLDHDYPFTGAADHGVSEAIYLDDPDGNGLELYWDRPKEQWPLNPDGSIHMDTKPLELQNLLDEIN